MGMIQTVLATLFGNGGNVLRETAEVFRENAEAGAGRASARHGRALEEFAAEFATRGGDGRGGFDRFMDGLNRLPRPALALGTLGLLVAAMVDPVWFAARMQGLALVPEPLWWLLGAIVSFYFGARYQLKGQDFQRSVARTLALTPLVQANLAQLRDQADAGPDAPAPVPLNAPNGQSNKGQAAPASTAAPNDRNAALEEWLAGQG